MEIFECYFLHAGHLCASLLGLPRLRDLTGFAFFLDHRETVSREGNVGKTDDFCRHGRSGVFDTIALVIDERPHLAELSAGHEEIADLEGAGLNQHRGYGAAA